MVSSQRLTFILFFLISTPNFSFAQEVPKKPSSIRFLIDLAAEFGGDEVAEVHFTDGERQSISAGQGLSLALGGQFQLPKAERFALRAAVGFKYNPSMAENANIRLTRLPIYLTANWMATNKIRLGAGLVNHQNIQYKADGFGQDIKFAGSSGPMFEVAFQGVALRYTSMKYNDEDDFSYSANSIGVSFTVMMPRR